MRLRWLIWLILPILAACSGAADLKEPPVDLGDFSLVHNIVVAPKVQKGPLSREASEQQLVDTMTLAIAERFDRYDGARDYHFGISMEGYVLAAPGVPLVFSPKSILIINVTVWDDALGRKLNDEPHQITVLETLGTGTIVGSGYTLEPEEQLRQLTQNASKAVERYLVSQMKEEGWFTGQPDDTTTTE